MPEPVYDDLLTRESERRLTQLVRDVPHPVAVAGGHAVRYVVEDAWRARTGEAYFGSRDIDIVYQVDPDWSRAEFEESAAGRAPARIRELGFQPIASFRFGLHLNPDGNVLEGEPGHSDQLGRDYHILYLDPMVTHVHPDAKAVLGFHPIDDDLLGHAFADPDLRTTREDLGEDVFVPTAPLLTATKLKSLPNRDKGDKEVKDLCDLYVLNDFGSATTDEVRSVIHRLLPDCPALVRTALNHERLSDAVDHLGLDRNEFEAVIGPLELAPDGSAGLS